MTREKKHGGGDAITGSVLVISIPCLKGLKGSVLAFSYQLSHQDRKKRFNALKHVRDNLPD